MVLVMGILEPLWDCRAKDLTEQATAHQYIRPVNIHDLYDDRGGREIVYR